MKTEELIEKSSHLGVTIAKNKRMMYWEDALYNVFDFGDKVWEEMLNDVALYTAPKYTSADVDAYIVVKYAHELKGSKI